MVESSTASPSLLVGESNQGSITPDGHYRYFAIGSMINPVSVSLRHLTPISSEPAELLKHRIGFYTSLGVANPIPDDTASFHGVVHIMEAEQMKKLDAGESGLHDRKTATARFYDGREEQVTVYISKYDEEKDVNLPHERYLEIMIDGCRHHGVDPKYIDYLQSLESIPRPTPESYKLFGEPPVEEFLSIQEALVNDGTDGKPYYFIVNNKVIECLLDKDSEEFKQVSFALQAMGDRIGEMMLSRIVYDPKFGVPKTLDDFTPEHAAYCENNFQYYLQTKNIADQFRTVARLLR